MNDKSEEQPILREDRMDQLLSVFYQTEIPEDLEQLPSTWREVGGIAAPTTSVSVNSMPFNSPQSRTGSRGIAAAVAALAACAMILAFSRLNVPPSQEGAGAPNGTGLMNVSEEGGNTSSGVVGNGDTTLEEIQSIDLAPPKPKLNPEKNVPETDE